MESKCMIKKYEKKIIVSKELKPYYDNYAKMLGIKTNQVINLALRNMVINDMPENNYDYIDKYLELKQSYKNKVREIKDNDEMDGEGKAILQESYPSMSIYLTDKVIEYSKDKAEEIKKLKKIKITYYDVIVSYLMYYREVKNPSKRLTDISELENATYLPHKRKYKKVKDINGEYEKSYTDSYKGKSTTISVPYYLIGRIREDAISYGIDMNALLVEYIIESCYEKYGYDNYNFSCYDEL